MKKLATCNANDASVNIKKICLVFTLNIINLIFIYQTSSIASGDRGGLAKLDMPLSGKSATRNALRWA